jgi:hypothetical protein
MIPMRTFSHSCLLDVDDRVKKPLAPRRRELDFTYLLASVDDQTVRNICAQLIFNQSAIREVLNHMVCVYFAIRRRAPRPLELDRDDTTCRSNQAIGFSQDSESSRSQRLAKKWLANQVLIKDLAARNTGPLSRSQAQPIEYKRKDHESRGHDRNIHRAYPSQQNTNRRIASPNAAYAPHRKLSDRARASPWATCQELPFTRNSRASLEGSAHSINFSCQALAQ